ncbi:D-alanine--poly(phosphoribitol) ligase subunit DltA [Colwellia psychrerythraea]|uniref:D-alanine--poly(Phosphoribitol) ligase, Phenylalanine racemase (ATP-hydrolyzing) n=1 Tax=Colwellia psychrerythraea TaxID=28229 RepID=A0A099KC84_COLPS|nr:D-alanine--poly(phosphoribitol) ligase subunit DltA [Colwellia psychrerythraea]KGJ87955.1 D-alanine--poly(phosphoribitol) ligase, Phenylalanine racemase (ATP-hydrolyzing) [Colwellia psychrerythraea]
MEKNIDNFFNTFLYHTKHHGDKTAVICGNEQITYQQLCQRALALSEHMQQQGVTSQQSVATHLPRSIDLVVAMLAIFNLNAIFVPLGIKVSEQKNRQKITQGQINAVIANSAKMIVNSKIKFIEINQQYQSTNSLRPLAKCYQVDDIAYVLFTSGTTGVPKGVKISHQALNRHLKWKNECYPVKQGGVELQKVPLSFDVSIRELLGWIHSGNTLCIIPEGDEGNPQVICRVIEQYQCEELSMVPCLLDALLAYIDAFSVSEQLFSLKRIIVGGEVLTINTVSTFKKLFKQQNIELINAYGPTETTIEITHFNCNDLTLSDDNRVPIGKAIYPGSLVICDEKNRPVRNGEMGELHVRGTQVANGYLNTSIKDNSRFYHHVETGQRSYKTGDLVHLAENGYLYYHGRIDEQIKINGHRFELPEIQQAFSPLVKPSLVVLSYDKSAQGHVITAYIHQSAILEQALTQKHIQQHLAQTLASYLIPHQFIMISSFAYLDSGKIDKKQLRNHVKAWPSFTGNNVTTPAIKQVIDMSIVEAFEHTAQLQPEKVAVYEPDKTITYRQLNNKANRIAHVLQHDFSVRTDTIIAILMPPGIDWLTCVLAILKTSAAYMPLSLNAPKLRNQDCLDDTQTSLLITDEQHVDQLSAKQICFTELLNTACSGPKLCDENLNIVRSPAGLFTVLFTSGSTGRPKGVMLENFGIQHRLQSKQINRPIAANQSMLLMTELTFDLVIFELLGWIYAQGSLTIMPLGKQAAPEAICQYVQNYQVAELIFAPSLLHAFLSYIEQYQLSYKLKGLNSILSAGDILRPDIVALFDRLLHQPYGIELINGYGPSEASILVSEFVVPSSANLAEISIGKAYQETPVFILDQHKRICPQGDIGQIAITGVGLARGYINDRQQTDDKFINQEEKPHCRLYLTGDRGYVDQAGLLHFCGREDHQVKVHGHRIELGEIDQAFHRFIPSNQAIVTAEKQGRETRLVAYVQQEAMKHAGLTPSQLKQQLLTILPPYLVPNIINLLQEIPLSANGKIDRQALTKLGMNLQVNSAGNTKHQPLLQIIKTVLSLTELPSEDDTLFELGVDSISIIHLVSELKCQLNWDVSLDKLNVNSTLAQLVDYSVNNKSNNGDFSNLFVTYNAQLKQTLYCFPPASSFGYAYHELAKVLKEFCFIAYHFPEHCDDVVALYCQHIISHSKNKPITLMGYSGGGNLAIAVAHKLESLGHTVVQIIMIDAFKLSDRLATLPADIVELQQQMIANTITELTNKGLKPHTINERVMAYYHHHWLAQPAIKTAINANLITLNSPKNDLVAQLTADPIMKAIFVPTWAESTNGQLTQLKGQGSHNEMLQAPYVQANANLLKPYLQTALCDSHSGGVS